MTTLRTALCAAVTATLASWAVAAPASGQDQRYGPDPQYDQDVRHDLDRGERDYGPARGFDEQNPRYRDDRLEGPGVGLLFPELLETHRNRVTVMRRFDFNRDGLIEPEEARAANRAFREGFFFDRERDGHRPPPPQYIAPALPPPPPGPAYDRNAMREYHFRQSAAGAVFTLPDVLFETGSARLRPNADAKLRPLANFLRGRSAQRLRIDGYTDSVGAAQANLILSRNRARSVAAALSAMGADSGRFQLEGHGEDSPVASNGDAAGRQLNRRVEVTLLGQHAATFQ